MRIAFIAALAPILALIAPACADEMLLPGEWRVERVAGAGAFDVAKTSFQFLPNGHLATTIGCNRMTGKLTIEGDRIEIGPMATTRMACPSPLDDVEMKYAAALDATRTVRVDGPRLILANLAGEILVVFLRVD